MGKLNFSVLRFTGISPESQVKKEVLLIKNCCYGTIDICTCNGSINHYGSGFKLSGFKT